MINHNVDYHTFQMALTDTQVKAAKPKEKLYRIADRNGLALVVKPNGTKLWHYRFRFEGTSKTHSIGAYPEISLAKARAAHAKAYELVKQGINPNQQKKAVAIEKKQNSLTFEELFTHWFTHWEAGVSQQVSSDALSSFERYVFPYIGQANAHALERSQVREVILKIEACGAIDVSRRALQRIKAAYRYGINNELVSASAVESLQAKDFLKPIKSKNHNRVEAKDLPKLLRDIDNYDGKPLTILALKMLCLTFVRVNELVSAEWNEINLREKQWVIPAEKMKMGRAHIVPLSDQAIAILKELKDFWASDRYLFPIDKNRSDKHMSAETPNTALHYMGYKGRMTAHGFRGVASTILHGKGYTDAWIEAQLAHQKKDKIAGAYNHAQYLPQRRKMMQEWADYLDLIKDEE